MQIEVIELKPVDLPKEYILRVNQDEMDLIAALIGRTYGGPNWVITLYESMQKHTCRLAEEIITDRDYEGNYKYMIIGLKNDKT